MAGTRTFVMIKPDAVERGLTGEITRLFESSGFIVRKMLSIQMTLEEAEALYDEHKNKPHFKDLTDYIMSGRVWCICFEKENAVADARAMIGDSNPDKRFPGTLRDLYAIDYRRNSIHGSDSDAAASREIKLFFKRK